MRSFWQASPQRGVEKTRLHHIHLAPQTAHDGLALIVKVPHRHNLKTQARLHVVHLRPQRERVAPRAHHRYAQAHRTAIARRSPGAAQRILGLAHDRARVVHQQRARRRHLDARVRPLEQRDAELGLEARNLLDECRRRHAQLCRRARETSQLRGVRNSVKSSIVHVNLPFSHARAHSTAGGRFRRSRAQLRTNLNA